MGSVTEAGASMSTMISAAVVVDALVKRYQGKLLSLDTPEALMRSLPGSSTLELTMEAHDGDTRELLLVELAALPNVERVEMIHDHATDGQESTFRVRLYVAGEAPQLVAPAAALLSQRGLTLSGVELGAPTLEDVFIHLTGRTLR